MLTKSCGFLGGHSLSLTSSSSSLNIRRWINATMQTGIGGTGTEPSVQQQPSLSSPWLMLPAEVDETKRHAMYKFYSLKDDKVFEMNKRIHQQNDYDKCLGSSKGWLAFVEPKQGQIYLYNPLSGRRIKLPPVETLHLINGIIRDDSTNDVTGYYIKPYNSVQELENFGWNIVLTSCFPGDDEDCIAMVIYDDILHIAFCRPGFDAKWRHLDGESGVYWSLAYHKRKGLFYVLGDKRQIEAWDLRNPSSPTRFQIHYKDHIPRDEWPTYVKNDYELEVKSYACITSDYLVYDDSLGAVFLVIRYGTRGVKDDGSYQEKTVFESEWFKYPSKTLYFDVFKLEFNKNTVEFKCVTNLANRAFFVGTLGECFCLPIPTTGTTLKGNSIYFTDGMYRFYYEDSWSWGGHDSGVYDFEKKTISPCYYPIDAKSFRRIKPCPYWFLPVQQ